MNEIERTELLSALYQVTSKADLLKQFDSKLSLAKGTHTQRYTHLLEQVVFFSHAIIFGHGVQTAHNYRQAFMTTAKKSKLLKMNDKDIETAFSFLNRTEKKNIIKAVEPQQPNKESYKVGDNCVAKDEIKRLKKELDTKSYTLAKGQKEEDKKIFIKVALVALATGARLKEITETLELSAKKGVISFVVDGKSEKGVMLELDIKTIRGYLKDIRSHYSERIAKGTDISTGIRKAVKRLAIKPPAKNIKKISVSGNLNDLNDLYVECRGKHPLTSSTPK